MADGRAVFTALLCVFFAVITGCAWGWSHGAGFAPLLVGGTGLVLCMFQLVEDLRTAGRTPKPIPRAAWQLLGWVVVFVLAVLLAGLLAGAFFAIAAFLRLRERDRYPVALGVAAAYTLAVWLLIDRVLDISLYRGLAGL